LVEHIIFSLCKLRWNLQTDLHNRKGQKLGCIRHTVVAGSWY